MCVLNGHPFQVVLRKKGSVCSTHVYLSGGCLQQICMQDRPKYQMHAGISGCIHTDWICMAGYVLELLINNSCIVIPYICSYTLIFIRMYIYTPRKFKNQILPIGSSESFHHHLKDYSLFGLGLTGYIWATAFICDDEDKMWLQAGFVEVLVSLAKRDQHEMGGTPKTR